MSHVLHANFQRLWVHEPEVGYNFYLALRQLTPGGYRAMKKCGTLCSWVDVRLTFHWGAEMTDAIFTEFEQREYDPDKAAFHWKKSGYDQPILLRTSENSFPGAPDAAALFQQSLQAAGIPMEIKREPNDGYWSEVWNSKPFCTSYWGGRPTQDQMFSTAYLSSADWNDTRFNVPRFDELLVSARAELDDAKRTDMYAEMGMILRDQGGLICPMFNDFIDAHTDRVAGWVEGAAGFALMNSYAPMKMWVA